MNAEDAAGRLKVVHWDRLKRLGSLAETSRRMGEKDGYLSGQRENPQGMRVQDAFVSLEIVGNPMPEELVHEAYFSEPKDPAGILLYSRPYQGLKPDSLLIRIAPRLEALAAADPVAHGDWRSVRNKIREIDRLRRRDRQAAYKKVRYLLNTAINKLTGAARPATAWVQLCSALGVLAAIYRLAGKLDDAVDLLALTQSLVRKTRDARAKAEWYQKAAFLLVDLGRHARAEEFVMQAHKFFDLSGSSMDRLGALVDLAYVFTHAQRHQESLDLLELVLPQLNEQDRDSRIAAHQICGKNLQEMGNYVAAGEHFDRALALTDEKEMARAYCLSMKVHFLLASGELSLALTTYPEYLDRFARFGGLNTVIKSTLEYLYWLRKKGPWVESRQELEVLTIRLRGWMGYLNAEYRLRAAAESLRALIEFGRLDDDSIFSILEEISSSLRGRRRRNSNLRQIAHLQARGLLDGGQKEARRAGR